MHEITHSPPTPAPTRAELMASHQQRVLSYYTQAQLDALLSLYRLVKRHWSCSGANAAATILLSLYNGRRFQVDLTSLRSMDEQHLADALTVIEMDARRCYAEVHAVIDAMLGRPHGTGAEFEHWAYDLGLRGRVKKAALPPRPRDVEGHAA